MTVHSLPLLRIHADSVDSTNDAVRAYYDGNHIVALSADLQTAGRGRNGKQWIGEMGKSVACSVLIPAAALPHGFLPQAAAALAIHRVVERFAANPHRDIRIKYPNDILVCHEGTWRKVSGILCEQVFSGSSLSYCIIGIGVNVLRQEFPPTSGAYQPVSIEEWCGTSQNTRQLSDDLVLLLLEMLSANPADVFAQWSKRLALANKTFTLNNDNGTWLFSSLDTSGILHVRRDGTDTPVAVYDSDSVRYDVE
ncbi:MAG: biotin--[acetyl-CoA-carboxylase] ligase [Candidatus Kapabacteria bacterium]|nr:biotin--[acetyl-CoA-carboxylase] ligase [Candidatus Kapabacteria bacterium]